MSQTPDLSKEFHPIQKPEKNSKFTPFVLEPAKIPNKLRQKDDRLINRVQKVKDKSEAKRLLTQIIHNHEH